MRVLKVLAMLGVAGLVLVGSCIGFMVHSGREKDRSSKAFIDEAIPAIVTSWDPNELERRSVPEATADAHQKESLEAFLKMCATKLGKMTQYKGAKGESFVSVNNNLFGGTSERTTARYVVEAEFEHGPAKLNVILRGSGGEWKIASFHVSSDLMLK